MKRMNITGLCLVAMCAMSAMVSTAMGAVPPELINLTGEALKRDRFRARSTSAQIFLETAAGSKVICREAVNEGEVTGLKTSRLKLILKTCMTTTNVVCTSSAPRARAAGEIVTNTLTGTLGFVNRGEERVGLSLTPEVAGSLVTEIECGATRNRIGEFRGRGGNSVIGKVTPTNKFTERIKLNFFCEPRTPGRQEIGAFEGGALDVLEGNNGVVEEKVCLNLPEYEITFEEMAEVKA
jgi:hypothetical protein